MTDKIKGFEIKNIAASSSTKQHDLVPGQKPCVHCGKCCRLEVCPVGIIFTRVTKPPCPALVREADNTYWCGLILTPEVSMFAPGPYEKYWARQLALYIRDNIFQFGKGCEID